MSEEKHKSVLLNEVMEWLGVKPDGRYVDGTLGLGGHAEAICRRLNHGQFLGLDVDPHNLEMAKRRLEPFRGMTNFRRANFRTLKNVLAEMKWDGVDGSLFDLGVASPQLDVAERGFSFQAEGPLDMRLDPDSPQTAAQALKRLDERSLETFLREFGEFRFARRLSREIVERSARNELKTTTDLAKLCERVVRVRGRTHPATRVFLALRCLVNDELGALKDLLAQAPGLLNVNGRIIVISFHSLEDRMVKYRFRELAQEGENQKMFRVLTKKPLVPSPAEEEINPRARSAKMRVLERVS